MKTGCEKPQIKRPCPPALTFKHKNVYKNTLHVILEIVDTWVTRVMTVV